MTVAGLFLTGCASIPMERKELSDAAKLFPHPPEGNSGIYIYRSSIAGSALKKDIWIDGKCIGESAPNTFFYENVAGDKEHTITTESEFSPNELKITTERNKNYFIEQYIKFGVFVGGADLKLVDEAQGKEEVLKSNMATKGTCSQ